MAAMVAPAGDRSMAMTRDCLEPASAPRRAGSSAVGGEGVAAEMGFGEAAKDFLARFDMEILRSVGSGVAPHHRSPTSANEPAGLDLRSAWAPETGHSSAPIALKCQSFLDNVVAQFGRPRACDVRRLELPTSRNWVPMLNTQR